MQNQRAWLSYDTFKLIVALLLLALFIVLLLNPAISPRSAAGLQLPPYPSASFIWRYESASQNLLNPQGVAVYTLDSGLNAWKPVVPPDLAASLPAGNRLMKDSSGWWLIVDAGGQTLYQWDAAHLGWVTLPVRLVSTATQPPPPTATLSPPSPTVLPTSTLPPTAVVEPTSAPTPEATATPEPAAQVTAPACSPPLPARLAVGGQARILSNLNLRSAPEIGNNLLRVNPVGMVLKILGGPQCVPFQGSAYLWWNVESPDGRQGWSAENWLDGRGYYLEPVP